MADVPGRLRAAATASLFFLVRRRYSIVSN